MPNPLGMDFTGERYVPDRGWAAIAYEHLARYLFSAGPAEGRRVLDVGSGEGYGARLLAETASEVVGVDVSEEAISHAAAKYAAGRANLTYRRASATALPFPAASFDLVTCFEML
ncbi:MAG: methyltransferase domain-containing protein, partial [Candidatus Methylomirabilis sp.]|nr:methyltransferase domain-containing protein [Deltaproteobacteria bacterium]